MVLTLQRMRHSGVIVTTVEAVLFEILGDATHPKFKEIQQLIRTLAPFSGLWQGKI